MKRPLPWDWIALALVGVAVFAIHFLFLGRSGPDDAYFGRALEQRTLAEFLVRRYQVWSARVPLEAMLVLLIHHETLWRIVNSLMVLLLCYGTGRLALRGSVTAPAATSIAFAVLMLMPAQVMQVAWWVTGSLNYLWPAAFGLYGSIRLVERTRRRAIENGLMVVASGLAVYHEQIAVILLPIQLALVVDRIRTGHRDPWDAIQIVWVVANVCVVFAAPGSYHRFLQEQLWWFPHFATLSLLERVNLGVGLVVRSVFDRDNLMVLLLAAGCIRLLLRRAPTPLMLLLLAGSTVFVVWAESGANRQRRRTVHRRCRPHRPARGDRIESTSTPDPGPRRLRHRYPVGRHRRGPGAEWCRRTAAVGLAGQRVPVDRVDWILADRTCLGRSSPVRGNGYSGTGHMSRSLREHRLGDCRDLARIRPGLTRARPQNTSSRSPNSNW